MKVVLISKSIFLLLTMLLPSNRCGYLNTVYNILRERRSKRIINMVVHDKLWRYRVQRNLFINQTLLRDSCLLDPPLEIDLIVSYEIYLNLAHIVLVILKTFQPCDPSPFPLIFTARIDTANYIVQRFRP